MLLFSFFLVQFLTPFLMNNTSNDRIQFTSVKDSVNLEKFGLKFQKYFSPSEGEKKHAYELSSYFKTINLKEQILRICKELRFLDLTKCCIFGGKKKGREIIRLPSSFVCLHDRTLFPTPKAEVWIWRRVGDSYSWNFISIFFQMQSFPFYLYSWSYFCS